MPLNMMIWYWYTKYIHKKLFLIGQRMKRFFNREVPSHLFQFWTKDLQSPQSSRSQRYRGYRWTWSFLFLWFSGWFSLWSRKNTGNKVPWQLSLVSLQPASKIKTQTVDTTQDKTWIQSNNISKNYRGKRTLIYIQIREFIFTLFILRVMNCRLHLSWVKSQCNKVFLQVFFLYLCHPFVYGNDTMYPETCLPFTCKGHRRYSW